MCQISIACTLRQSWQHSRCRVLRESWQPSNARDFWHKSDNTSDPWEFRHISGNTSSQQGSLHMAHLDLATLYPPRTAGKQTDAEDGAGSRLRLASFCHRVCFAFWNLMQSCGVFSQLVMYYYVKDFFNIMFVQNVSCAVKMWQVMKYDSLSCFTNRYCPVKSNLHTLIYHDAAGKARKWQGRSRSKKEDCCQAKLGIII